MALMRHRDARVLKARGMIPALMGTRPFADVRLEFVRQLRDVLTAEWNAELAVFVVTELELNKCKYQKLRLAEYSLACHFMTLPDPKLLGYDSQKSEHIHVKLCS
jgi:hypothetical protein